MVNFALFYILEANHYAFLILNEREIDFHLFKAEVSKNFHIILRIVYSDTIDFLYQNLF